MRLDDEREVPLNQAALAALEAAKHVPAAAISRAARKAKLGRPVGWHLLRSTFASWLAQRGVPMKAIQELIGHGSMSVTMRYAVLSPDVRKEAVAVLDSPVPQEPPAACNDPVIRPPQGRTSEEKPHAQGGIRTRTPFGATPSRWCVYQFHHLGLKEDGLRIRDPRRFPVPP